MFPMSKSDKWLSECDCKACDCTGRFWCTSHKVVWGASLDGTRPAGSEIEPGCDCCREVCTRKSAIRDRRWQWIHDLDLDHDAEKDVVPRLLLTRDQIGNCQVAGTGRTFNQQAHTCPHAPYIYRHVAKWRGIKFDLWTHICVQHLRKIFDRDELERKLQRADAAWAYRETCKYDYEPMAALRHIIGTIRAGIAERAEVGELDA